MEQAAKSERMKYLSDYRPPDFLVESVALTFLLDAQATEVESTLLMQRNPLCENAQAPLCLDGEGLTLLALQLDGENLPAERYQCTAEQLIIAAVPERFRLQMRTRIHPAANTALQGLYGSGTLLCTQCEAEGFRKITYYLDRPDVMAVFSTTLIADRDAYPVLLANGNRIEAGILPDNRHFATWQDPHRKPCYLFALVAGRLYCHRDRFVTRSGRAVSLEIYVESQETLLPEPGGQTAHAMRALQKAMAWDEERFGCEYDLDVYMIVAVHDFNAGAMENKGLNLFNAKYVLADQESATDLDFQQIESIIAHEYFHNWSGNRVTCRDWFQLSLKEGLTVFRDQLFSADTLSPAVQRVQEARLIRTRQFAEDAGPTAHPVQPDAYLEINNFYTSTVYEKGAEVVRMIHTLLGEGAFRRGMDLYFSRHDGQAVTVEEFVRAMEEASGRDLQQFRRWYRQAGTPLLRAKVVYEADTQRLTLQVRQSCPATPGQAVKEPFHIPLTVGLLDRSGAPLPLCLADDPAQAEAPLSRVLELRAEEEQFVFTGLEQPPVVSLLRHFSAPVAMEVNLDAQSLAFLWAHDPDLFNRWSAGQRLTSEVLVRLAVDARIPFPFTLEHCYIDGFARVLRDEALDPAAMAMILTLPSEVALLEQMEEADPTALHRAREFVRQTLAQELHELFLGCYHRQEEAIARLPAQVYHPQMAGRRALKNLCLDFLASLQWAEFWDLTMRQFERADNMTDRLAALRSLLHSGSPEGEQALHAFAERWQGNPLVLDKWFALQAGVPAAATLQRVQQLAESPWYSQRNPNRVRALLGTFCHDNPFAFHQESGESYRWIARQVLQLDELNPQVAARLVSAFSRWRKLEPGRQQKMLAALRAIEQAEALSPDVFEIVLKSLKH
ncbi:MAG: aminopeptidase N [Magnetococcales bacterium]|nr:aminopeptidase N [Magnetococcales bacterium]MBF0115599.1 aminopeptidase N [Magnetococcales bacterium]